MIVVIYGMNSVAAPPPPLRAASSLADKSPLSISFNECSSIKCVIRDNDTQSTDYRGRYFLFDSINLWIEIRNMKTKCETKSIKMSRVECNLID